MELVICSIYDSVSEHWHNPLVFQSKGQAIRAFADAVNGDTDFSKHPTDYSLFALGTFNGKTGAVVLESAPVSLTTGVNVKINPGE